MKLFGFLAALIIFIAAAPGGVSATTVTMGEDGKAVAQMNNPEPVIPEGNLYVPKDTRVKVIVPQQLTTRLLKTDDTIIFKLKEDFIVNGTVLAPKDTNVFGTVRQAKESWGWGHGGELYIQMIGFGTYRNVLVPLENYLHYKGDSMSDMAIQFAYGVIGGMLIWGDNGIIPAGTQFIMRVPRDIDLGTTPGILGRLGVYAGIPWSERESEISLTQSIHPPVYDQE